MSRFQSTRQALDAVDVSRSSASSLDPALISLSPEDAEVLEAIVMKSPGATAFMAVFKAYSEVLQQRGLDPGNDVVYYKQLLKLGVVKGADWGTKWSIVKNQLGLSLSGTTTGQPEGRILPEELAELPSDAREEDVFTLHSHADETETAVDPPNRLGTRFRRPYSAHRFSSTTNLLESLDLNSESSMVVATPPSSRPVRQLVAPRTRLVPSPSEGSEVLDEPPIRSSTPPVRRVRRECSPDPIPKSRESKGKGREQPVSCINDAEAWRKVEQERDADRFRRESLLCMCFETWKVGLDWARTTHTQIVDARNHIQLRIHFERWRERTARFHHISERAMQVAHFRIQTLSFNVWKEKTQRKRMAAWREEMRSRMVWIKRRRQERLRNDAWTKWRQSYRSRQLYARNIFLRTFRRWKEKLQKTTSLESLAHKYEDARVRRTLENVMETWTRCVQMHDAENYLVHKASQRISASAFETWFCNARDNHLADAHNALRLLKRIFEVWRFAKANMHLLNLRGDKHLRRRDNLLLRAVVRVWVARERGQLMSRVKRTRLIKDAFTVWQQRQKDYLKMQDRAVAYSEQASGSLLVSAFKTWVGHRNIQHNALLLAEQRYIADLLYRTLLAWRLQLRARLKLARQAKMARRYFVERHAWDKWRLVLEESRRKRTIIVLEREKIKRTFSRWQDATRRKKHQEHATEEIAKRMRKRVLGSVLQHWTDRVVSLKLREIDTVEQRERDIIVSAFTKWKDMCLQHMENLSLVNSFQDVKREDALRRMFLKWLAAARRSKARRIRLAEREHELRLETLAAAWETWRDHFRENRLRDLEYQVIIQNQTNSLYGAFTFWHSRSKSVPGIRFYATNLKNKVWDKWCAAMPLAMQARKAREVDAKNVLAAAFQRWADAHKTKIALKAVARARYLRLPSPGQRASNSAPQSQDPPPLRPLLHRPLRSRTPGLDDEATPGTSQTSTPAPAHFTRRRGLSSLLASRPASRAATAEGSSRPAAPPSSAGGDNHRERLWSKLRGASLRAVNRAKSN